jgi:hypothetical protein
MVTGARRPIGRLLPGDRVSGERDRVTVTLATGIPEDVTRAADLDYLDPAQVAPAAWAADPDTLVVPDAGEDLYRLW